MCEFSQRLIAWLDRELPVDKALEVELHLGGCADCQRELRTYERLSTALDAYCDAAMESRAPQTEPRWPPVLLGASAVVAVLALLLTSPRMRKAEPPTGEEFASVPASTSLVIADTARAPLNSVIPSPPRRARDLSSVRTNGERDYSAKDTPRFTESVLRDRNDNLLNVSNVRATPAAAGWQLAEPAIQIAIPAEAILPPGAAPEGVSFVAEVSIAPDGSAHQIFLQP
jgi:anti-sigma factor RsiW